MTEEQVKRGLNMIRYTGILVTVLFLIATLAFGVLVNNQSGTQIALSALLPYIIGGTIALAVLFIVVYFVYGAIQRGRITR